MKKRSPPLPSPSFIPMTVTEQLGFPSWVQNGHYDSLWRFECDLSDGLLETGHLYGVQVKHLDLVYFGDNVYVTMTLSAGTWTGRKTFGANRAKHPVSRLCANLLRFLRHNNEDLG